MQDLCTPVSGSTKIAAYSFQLVNPTHHIDVTNNNSNKTYTVPTATLWEIKSIFIKYMSTATVGDRMIRLTIRDPNDNRIYETFICPNFAANLTRYINLAPALTYGDEQSTRGYFTGGLPPFILLPNSTIQISDYNNVDLEADDMHVSFSYNSISI